MNDLQNLYQECVENPNSVNHVIPLVDCLEENGCVDTAKYVKYNGLVVCGDGDDDYGGYGDGGDDYGGYGDDGYGDDYGGYGDDGYGDDYGGYDYGGYGDGGDDYGDKKQVTLWNPTMENGFYIITVSAGYSPYVLVGWVERIDFILRVRNSCVIRRFGQHAQLSKIAKEGPKDGSNPTQLLDMSEEEYVPLASVGRAIPANPKKWPMCIKPK